MDKTNSGVRDIFNLHWEKVVEELKTTINFLAYTIDCFRGDDYEHWGGGEELMKHEVFRGFKYGEMMVQFEFHVGHGRKLREMSADIYFSNGKSLVYVYGNVSGYRNIDVWLANRPHRKIAKKIIKELNSRL